MGQRTHPLGIRLKAIQNKFFFQRVGQLNIGGLFYLFYSHSFRNKSIVGEKLGQSVLIEKIIIFFFSRHLYFVNKIFFLETSTNVLVLLEYYSFKKKNSKVFQKHKFLLLQHLSSILLDQKPVTFFIMDLETKILQKNLLVTLAVKNHFKKFKLGSDTLLSVGLINNFWPGATLFSSIFCFFFRKTMEHTKILDFIDQLFYFLFNLKFSKFIGIRLEIKGRLNSMDRTNKRVVFQGSLPLQSFSKIFLSYGFSESITPYGVCGVRVYFTYKNSFKC